MRQKLFSIEFRQDLLEILFTNDIKPREQKIMDYRFGLTSNSTHTLEETGQEYGVTRERIRQIEWKGWNQIPVEVLEKFIEKYPEESMSISQLKATWVKHMNKK